MKRFIAAFMLLMLPALSPYAAPFSPTLLRLYAPSSILYTFDGKSLSIPLTVSGTPASAFFLVFTKGKATSIKKIMNGYLGWHYVNKIDTCLYVSPAISLINCEFRKRCLQYFGKEVIDRFFVRGHSFKRSMWFYPVVVIDEPFQLVLAMN